MNQKNQTDTYEVKIEKLASNGYGLAFINGMAVFVKFAYPGEIHEIEIFSKKKDHAFAKSIKTITGLENKREPECGLFKSCGGCQFQDIDYDYQLELKNTVLKESLKRIGKIEIEPLPIIASDNEYRYRNKGSFQVRQGKPGYCYPGTTKVFNFDSCLLLDESIEKHVMSLSSRAELDNIKMINVRSNLKGEVIDSRDKHSSFIEELDGIKFVVDINSFFQVNKTVFPKWLKYIKSLVSENDNFIVDLYCGVGAISMYIAGEAKRVTGIEINKKQIKQANQCLEMNNISNVNYISADAEEFLEHSGRKIDLLVTNPPRAGMSKWTVRDIIENPAKHLIYSSCNPDTFSRDARMLIDGGYNLKSIQPFDMFPQTHHLEIVADFLFEGRQS